MVLYPNLYLQRITEITLDLLNKCNIKGLILDVDNTLIDFDKNIPEEIPSWCENLKNNNIKMCIVSNTNKKNKVEKVAKELGLEYIFFAHKPSKKGLLKAQKLLELNVENIAVVGDQILTDVWGGNRCKMFTILTVPIEKRDIFITKLKRPIEKVIIKMYLKKTNRGE